MSKLVGVRFGEFEGNKWAKLEIVEPATGAGCVGSRVYEDKCDYNVACEVMKDWALYENAEVHLGRGRHDRVESVDLLN